MDQAAGRIASEQGTLRPLENFDPVDIEQLEVEARERALVDFIDVNRLGAFVVVAEIVEAHAANGDIRDIASAKYR